MKRRHTQPRRTADPSPQVPPAQIRAALPTYALLLLALAGGIGVPLTLAPFDWWWLGPLAVALNLYVLQRARNLRVGFLLGWAFGVGKFGLGVSWIYVSIHTYGHASPALAGFLVALFVAAMALFHGVLGAVFVWRYQAAGMRAALGFAGLWLLFDWLLTWVFTGFPWLLLGYGHLTTPLSGYVPLLGVHGVTAIVVLTGVLLVQLVAPVHAVGRAVPEATGPGVNARRWLIPAVLTVLWLGGYAVAPLNFVQVQAEREVALVQGNIAQDTKWDPETVGRTLETYVGLSRSHMDVDVLLWPEAALTLLLEQAGPFLDDMGQRMAQHGGALVTGIVSWQPEQGIRNLSVVAGDGEGVYVKRRLVPFGEYVPLEGLLRGLIGFFDLPMSHTEPGADRQPLLRAGDARIAMAICYEIVYPGLVREQAQGANLLATISNDTWFGTSIGPLQHLQMAQMRALELGRWMLRATNNGVTALIDARGQVVARLPQFQTGVLRGKVQLMVGETPYARFGDWPVRLLFVVLLGLGWRRSMGQAVSA